MPKLLKLISCVVVTFACFLSNAHASLIRLDATAIEAPGSPIQYSDFFVLFDDINNDGLFSLAELQQFSGLEVSFGPRDRALHTISYTPDINGISLASGSLPANTSSDNWVFDSSVVTQLNFSYATSLVDATVPEPSSAILIALGLLGILAANRKRASTPNKIPA